MARKKTATPWEIAKPILRELYLDGSIDDAMKPKEVWALQPEFVDVKYENFRTNFAKMKKSIKENQNRADNDETGFLHDMTIYKLAKVSGGYWDGSEAQQLLKRDIRKRRHEKMKPEFLHLSRSQYQEFSLEKFRGHIHQELRSERETNYWIVKKRKKQRADLAKRNGNIVNEEDMDVFFDPVLDM